MTPIMYAAESGAEVAKSAMDAVIGAMADAFTLTGTIITQITNQPILLYLLAVSLIPTGIGIFSRLKNAARG